jgi:hypothetical protein
VTSGRGSGFCITITYRATYRLCCNSSPRKTFLSSQPPHSPFFVPSDFWLFPTMKISLKQTASKFPKILKEAFYRCFQQWQDRWCKYVFVCKGCTLKATRYALPYVLPLQCSMIIVIISIYNPTNSVFLTIGANSLIPIQKFLQLLGAGHPDSYIVLSLFN